MKNYWGSSLESFDAKNIEKSISCSQLQDKNELPLKNSIKTRT